MVGVIQTWRTGQELGGAVRSYFLKTFILPNCEAAAKISGETLTETAWWARE